MEFHESKLNSVGQKRALVDIDETICYYEDKRRYDLSIPLYKNIEKINRMYDEGWEIIYWTGTCDNPKPHFDLVIDDKAKRIEEID